MGLPDGREIKRDGRRSDFDGIGMRCVAASESCRNGPVKQRRRETDKQSNGCDATYHTK
jgi:hypothetical protein